MKVRSLVELTPGQGRTVIINLHTDLLATRAILSATLRSDDPVLLVNCAPTEESRRRFERLGSSAKFDVIEAPAQEHGQVLDWLFNNLSDERLLLLDSEAELRSSELVPWMRNMLGHQRCFGAGFTDGPFFVPEELQAPDREFLVVERPWMPCVM